MSESLKVPSANQGIEQPAGVGSNHFASSKRERVQGHHRDIVSSVKRCPALIQSGIRQLPVILLLGLAGKEALIGQGLAKRVVSYKEQPARETPPDFQLQAIVV